MKEVIEFIIIGDFIYVYIYREGPSDFLIYHFDVISLAVSSLEGKSLDLLLGGGLLEELVRTFKFFLTLQSLGDLSFITGNCWRSGVYGI